MKPLIWMAVPIGLLLAGWIGWGIYTITTTERPPYEVLERLGSDVEVRQYEDQTWISTEYDTDNSAFRVLASYIFGQNEEGAPVAMTAPVITDREMSFILPADVTRASAPTPLGQPIAFTEVPARKLATIQFSWTTSEDRVRRKTDKLLEVLASNDVVTKGDPFLMRYNDPGTPPFMRRNEVAIEVQ